MPKTHITKNFIRERQISPSKCAKGSFMTKTISKNVKLVAAKRRKK